MGANDTDDEYESVPLELEYIHLGQRVMYLLFSVGPDTLAKTEIEIPTGETAEQFHSRIDLAGLEIAGDDLLFIDTKQQLLTETTERFPLDPATIGLD